MALKSIMLMVLAVIILVVPGMLYNNLNNNGLVVAQSKTLSCSSDAQTPTCQISGTVGCQASSSYCTLSGSSISFLSHTSIFTALLSGNIFALWGSINNQGSNVRHGPFDLMGGSNVAQIQANCVVDSSAGTALTRWTFRSCNQSDGNGANLTHAQSNTWNNWNSGYLGSVKTYTFNSLVKSNASATFSCVYNFQLNYTTGGKSTGFTWYGCSYQNGTGCIVPFGCTVNNADFDFWVAIPLEYGVLVNANGYACAPNTCFRMNNLPVALTLWETRLCSQTSGTASPGSLLSYSTSDPCNQFWKSLNSAVQTAGSNSLSFGLLTPVILFIIGLILLFIGLGVGIGVGGSVLGTGTTASMQENEAGTRLAQSLGLGLVVWSPLYSEFSTWFTSGLLPYGFDGTTGIIALLLSGLFFFGVFWRAISRD